MSLAPPPPIVAYPHGVLWHVSPPVPAAPSASAKLNSLVVGLLGLVCICLIVLIYYKLFSKYCTDCNIGLRRDRSTVAFRGDPLLDAWQGLSESVIRLIPVFRFTPNDERFQSKECAVCLCSFAEGDVLRLLPSCNHGFHIHCIDSWLQSHSSCPLCRTDILDLGRNFIPVMSPPIAIPEDRIPIPVFMRFDHGSYVDLDESSGELQWARLERSSSSHRYRCKDVSDGVMETQKVVRDEEGNICAMDLSDGNEDARAEKRVKLFFQRSASLNTERSARFFSPDALESGLLKGSPADVTRKGTPADTSPRRNVRIARTLRRTVSARWTFLSSERKSSNRSTRWVSGPLVECAGNRGEGDGLSECSSASNSGPLRAPNSCNREAPHRSVQEPLLEAFSDQIHDTTTISLLTL